MFIERMELNHFRNYDRFRLEPHEGINIFFGQNGSGKTNLLEAIHYCSLGKSHRVNQDTNAVMMGEKNASCVLSIQGSRGHHEIEIRLQPGEENIKSVWIDKKKASRLSEMMGILRCVIFSPEDLDLIKEGPANRRKFLDMMISQISQSYFIALQQYRIALNQRNAILRTAKMENRPVNPMIEDFESAMAQYAKIICEEREKYIRMLSESANLLYGKISGRETEAFEVQYHPSLKNTSGADFSMKEMLQQTREEDLRQGVTTLGPQRDDLAMSLNKRSMKLYASQGQIRTGALSLKLAQMKIFQSVTGEQPVLLLDDVMSELDLNRRMNLLEIMDGIQTFVTCADEGDLAEYQNHRTWHVFSEKGKANVNLVKPGPESERFQLKEPVFEI